MIRIAICDDIQGTAEAIKNLLLAYDYGETLEIDCFECGEQLYTQFIKKKYNILLTDIELTPEGYSNELLKNGMLLADKIKDLYPETIVIFLSRFSYEKELLKHEPFGFIDKPNGRNDERITENVGKAVRRLQNRAEQETMFQIKSNGFTMGKMIKDIIYFESKRPKVIMVTIDEEYIFRSRLDQVQANIEKSAENFIRVSKSYYINARYIKGYVSREVTMINGAVIPISRKYLEEFRKKVDEKC